MKEIKFLVWNSPLALEQSSMDFVNNSIYKISKILEEEINLQGGICNKRVSIIYRYFPKGEDGIKKIIELLDKERDIIALNGSHISKNSDELLNRINLNESLYFSQFPKNEILKNHFSLSFSAEEGKIKFLEYFLKNNFFGKHVHYFNGTRKSYLNETRNMLENSNKNFTLHDISEISDDNRDKFLHNLIKSVNDDDLIILNVGIKSIKCIFEFLNENKKLIPVIKLFGSIEGRFQKINFPLIELAAKNHFPSLTFEKICEKIDYNLSNENKKLIYDSFWRLEIPLLVAYASNNLQGNLNNKETILENISKALNKVDSVKDIFIGKSRYYGFKENNNIIKYLYAYSFPNSLQSNGGIPSIFYPYQFLYDGSNFVYKEVTSVYIDIIRITKVDIGESIWSCEFFLDIVSTHKDPLEIINFNNLSLIDSKFETKLIKQSKDEQFGGTNYRYYIVANFDFLAIADNYPFDWQHIYISMSISDQNKFGILQPIPEALLDKEFQLDGWRLMDAKTGVLRKKETHHQNASLEQVIEVREEIRVGWTIARTNVVTTMKVVIPIIFLMFLNYYTFFLSYNDVSTAIGILTTTFLSGIALYFSTEKPQPLRITTIDLIFIYYYLQVGISVIVTAVTGFTSETIFNYSMLGMKFLLPLSILTALLFLYRRVKSVRLRPRIDA